MPLTFTWTNPLDGTEHPDTFCTITQINGLVGEANQIECLVRYYDASDKWQCGWGGITTRVYTCAGDEYATYFSPETLVKAGGNLAAQAEAWLLATQADFAQATVIPYPDAPSAKALKAMSLAPGVSAPRVIG